MTQRRPHLVVNPWIKGRELTYECSGCGQVFVPPEDRTPKEAMAELLMAFDEHVSEKHTREANDEDGGAAGPPSSLKTT